jgi:hypothetical protein
VNVAAASALRAYAGVADYASAKDGIVAFTRNAARELHPLNIQVNAIIPVARTRMIDALGAYYEKALGARGQPHHRGRVTSGAGPSVSVFRQLRLRLHDVESSEAALDCLGQSADFLVLANVEQPAVRLRASLPHLFDRMFEGVLVAMAHQKNARPFACEGPRDDASDTAAGAGDQKQASTFGFFQPAHDLFLQLPLAFLQQCDEYMIIKLQ